MVRDNISWHGLIYVAHLSHLTWSESILLVVLFDCYSSWIFLFYNSKFIMDFPFLYLLLWFVKLVVPVFLFIILLVLPLLFNQAGLALGDLKSVKDLYDFKTLSVLFLIGFVSILPTVLKRKRVYEWSRAGTA
jgi:hypothetical protein